MIYTKGITMVALAAIALTAAVPAEAFRTSSNGQTAKNAARNGSISAPLTTSIRPMPRKNGWIVTNPFTGSKHHLTARQYRDLQRSSQRVRRGTMVIHEHNYVTGGKPPHGYHYDQSGNLRCCGQ